MEHTYAVKFPPKIFNASALTVNASLKPRAHSDQPKTV